MKNSDLQLLGGYLPGMKIPPPGGSRVVGQIDYTGGLLNYTRLGGTESIGIISEVDPFREHIKFLMHFDGEDNGAVFTADGYSGNITVDRVVTKADADAIGGCAASFSVDGSRLALAAAPCFDFRSQVFTIDCWVKLDSLGKINTLYSDWIGGTAAKCSNYFRIAPGGELCLGFGIGSLNGAAQTSGSGRCVVAGVWTHVAVTRAGQFAHFYIDGQLVQSVQLPSGAALNPALTPVIGRLSSQQGFVGRMDEFCITFADRYGAQNFTPRRTPYVFPGT